MAIALRINPDMQGHKMKKDLPLPFPGETAEQYRRRLLKVGFGVKNREIPPDGKKRSRDRLQDQLMSLIPLRRRISDSSLRKKLFGKGSEWGEDYIFEKTLSLCRDMGLIEVEPDGGISRTRAKYPPDPLTEPLDKNEYDATHAKLFDEAVMLVEQGESYSAFNIWLFQAIAGFAPAQFRLAIMYLRGQDIPADSREAFCWLTEASNSNHVQARIMLAQMIKARIGFGDSE